MASTVRNLIQHILWKWLLLHLWYSKLRSFTGFLKSKMIFIGVINDEEKICASCPNLYICHVRIIIWFQYIGIVCVLYVINEQTHGCLKNIKLYHFYKDLWHMFIC